MRRAIALSLTLLTCSAQANNLCTLNSANADKTVKIMGVPGYFFKVHPDGDVITFIETEHNTMIDLNTGKEYPTVGNIDPVWSPDGKFLTHPGYDPKTSLPIGLQFYGSEKIKEATKAGKSSEAVGSGSALMGVYQSIGKNKDGTYNIVSDADGISLGKFTYSERTGPQLVGNIERPCPNAGLDTDLPMISKDGRFLSFYDRDSKSTKIYNVARNCELAMDLGYGTGKVSFNADSSQIAFHVDQFADFQDGYFSGVGKDKVKNVVVLNLDETEDGKLKASSWAMASKSAHPGDGGYYPDFDKNGNIYYMEDVDNNFQFVKVNPDKLEFRPMEGDLLFGKSHSATCEDSPTDILAKMWKEVCAKENALPMDEYREFTMAIDPLECKKMVESFYVPSMKVSKEDLLKTCPQKSATKAHEVGEWNLEAKNQAEALLKGKCITCHRNPKAFEATESIWIQTGPNDGIEEKYTYKKKIPAISIDKMDRKLADQMLAAIYSKKMPKKEPLSESEKNLLVQYLQKKTLDMPEERSNNYMYARRYTDAYLEIERQNFLKVNPGLSPENKELMISTIDCIYGQKNCSLYLDSANKIATTQAQSLPEDSREKFINDKMMEARCMNLIEVTPQQCQEWDQSRKPAK